MVDQSQIILVLEDEKPLLEAIKTKLESHSMNVVCARSVEQGLSYLRDIPEIAGIWLDHYLIDKETGIDFVIKTKEMGEPYSSIPIFVISNNATNEEVDEYMKLGVNEYYIKSNFKLADIITDLQERLNS